MKFSRFLPILLIACAVIGTQLGLFEPAGESGISSQAPGAAPQSIPSSLQGLPPEAITVLELIQRGGPFPHRQDGTTFQNRERLLPQKPRGYYREYTIPTPGARDRGARRWVVGGQPPEVYYYTPDHYRSFRKIEVPR
jgi:guanyl-specific ribonuclease Sa